MKKVIVTQKGAALKCNPWKEGEVISAHPNIADHFIKGGLATEIGDSESSNKNEPSKNKKTK